MSIRPVKRIIDAKPTIEGAGVKLRRAFGFGETEVAATVNGPSTATCWTPSEQALIALVDDLVDRRSIADLTWSALAAHFDEAQILEAIALAGYYHAISFLARGLALPLEPWATRFPVSSGAASPG